MPVITDAAEVRKDLALAMLALITHGADRDHGAILKAMTTALRETPDNVKNPIAELISQGLGNLPAAALWRKLVAVDLSFYKSPLSEEIRDEGRVESRAEDILFILEQRGIDVPEDVRERITGCDDTETLLGWLGRAITTPSAEDLFSDA